MGLRGDSVKSVMGGKAFGRVMTTASSTSQVIAHVPVALAGIAWVKAYDGGGAVECRRGLCVLADRSSGIVRGRTAEGELEGVERSQGP